MTRISRCVDAVAAATILTMFAGSAQAQSAATGRAELTAYIDGLAREHLKARQGEVAKLKTQAEAEARRDRNRRRCWS
jgi:hypothetical protein